MCPLTRPGHQDQAPETANPVKSLNHQRQKQAECWVLWRENCTKLEHFFPPRLINDFLVVIRRDLILYNHPMPCQDADHCSRFRAFDTDGDGKISKDEFRICMLNFGERFGEEEISDMVRQADSDMDGSINFIEFVQMLTQAETNIPTSPKELRRKLSRKYLWS